MRARIFAPETRKWFTLAAVAFGLFMIMLDNTVVNVALPSIQRDLEVGLSELEWIVTGYALTFAALMLIGGKVADAYGRRLIFVVGIAVFTLASLCCGLASSGETKVIAARARVRSRAAADRPPGRRRRRVRQRGGCPARRGTPSRRAFPRGARS